MLGVVIIGINGVLGQDVGKICVCGIGILNEVGFYILVDGIEIGILSVVDFNDIESIFVLKDVVLVVIYGFKVVNGVVLIIIKCGKIGQIKIFYSGYLSFQNVMNMIECMGLYEYVFLLNQVLEVEGMLKCFNDIEL